MYILILHNWFSPFHYDFQTYNKSKEFKMITIILAVWVPPLELHAFLSLSMYLSIFTHLLIHLICISMHLSVIIYPFIHLVFDVFKNKLQASVHSLSSTSACMPLMYLLSGIFFFFFNINFMYSGNSQMLNVHSLGTWQMHTYVQPKTRSGSRLFPSPPSLFPSH